MKYKTILIDPPWDIAVSGNRSRSKGVHGDSSLPYKTLSVQQIKDMPISDLADVGCHLWLWTTNQTMADGFDIMKHWGFKFLAPIHWIKPSGMGNYFIHRSQTLLFGYFEKCQFPLARYVKNIIEAPVPKKHSQKPAESYEYIESISPKPRLEMFARAKRDGWHAWGNEVESDISMSV